MVKRIRIDILVSDAETDGGPISDAFLQSLSEHIEDVVDDGNPNLLSIVVSDANETESQAFHDANDDLRDENNLPPAR